MFYHLHVTVNEDSWCMYVFATLLPLDDFRCSPECSCPPHVFVLIISSCRIVGISSGHARVWAQPRPRLLHLSHVFLPRSRAAPTGAGSICPSEVRVCATGQLHVHRLHQVRLCMADTRSPHGSRLGATLILVFRARSNKILNTHVRKRCANSENHSTSDLGIFHCEALASFNDLCLFGALGIHRL